MAVTVFPVLGRETYSLCGLKQGSKGGKAIASIVLEGGWRRRETCGVVYTK